MERAQLAIECASAGGIACGPACPLELDADQHEQARMIVIRAQH